MEVHRWRLPAFATTMSAALTAAPTGHPKTAIPGANKLIAVVSVITIPPSPDGNRRYYSEATQTQAVAIYVEGMCVLSISRTLDVKPEAV